MARHNQPPGITLLEALFVVLLILFLVAILLPALGGRGDTSMFKDGTQIRGIQQAMVTFAGNNQDTYPLPSLLDAQDTLPAIGGVQLQGAEKDLPRWIISLMIYNGLFGPELSVSPKESNRSIRIDNNYEFSNPSAVEASKRSIAILDPAFAAFSNEPGGDTPIQRQGRFAPGAACSYAMVPLAGARRAVWSSTFDGTQAIIGNRGPWYEQNAAGEWLLNRKDRRGAAKIRASGSNTLLIHGARTSWEGNVARNDGSINFETRPDPENIPLFHWSSDGGSNPVPTRFDNIFANEDEQSAAARYSPSDDDITEATNTRRNNYLRCFGDRAARTFDADRKKLLAIGGFWYD
ncbi:MAG TPA: hypothetical protein VF777_12520 [Phycisphaerales bacterium]